MPQAVGVPTRSGPPDWFDPAPPSGTGDTTLDDPRWNGATGQSFQLGGAEAPLHTLAIWFNTGGHRNLYLSFISDLASSDPSSPDPSNPTLPRDVYLGFRRVTPVNGEFGYIFEFHLGQPQPAGSTLNAQPLAYCGLFSSCPQNTNWWRVFVDNNQGDGSCTSPDPSVGTVNGERYSPFNGTGADPVHTPPISWLNNSVHFWQIGAPGSGALLNRWAVQVRLQFAPFVAPAAWAATHAYAVNDLVTNGSQIYRCITAGTSAASGGPTRTGSNITDGTAHWTPATAIEQGMEEGAPFWYEATENPVAGQSYLSIGKFPTQDATFSGVTTSLCKNSATIGGDSLVHAELGGACPTCNLQAYAHLTAFGDALPTGTSCDGGLDIESGNIGALYDPASNPTFNVDTQSPPTEFSAPQPNRLIAQVHNLTGAPVNNLPLMARFRLADWGSSPFTPGSVDRGTFDPIPGTENGVCAAGTPPNCVGTYSIAAGAQKAITFDWTLSDSDKCSYQIPGTSCDNTCVCDHTNGCDSDPTTPVGTLGTRPMGTTTCFKLHAAHECMYVELSAPNGGVTFEHQSAFHNMNFGTMSTLARPALIDARKLPVLPGQLYQDIYLLVMPRNMPTSVPASTTTTSLVQNAAINSALTVAQPYIDDLNRQQVFVKQDKPVPPPPEVVTGGGEGSGSGSGSGASGDVRVQQILRAREAMSAVDRQRVDALLSFALTPQQSKTPSSDQVHQALAVLGPEGAGAVVPTLDIYPFYLPGARGHIYQPMTAFTVFLSHEDTLSGVRYQIDGATKVGGNVYHMTIPVGKAREIQVRAQALVGNEVPLPPGNPAWPCTGGCACGGAQHNCGLVAMVSNSMPVLLAGVFLVRRRRKRAGKTPS